MDLGNRAWEMADMLEQVPEDIVKEYTDRITSAESLSDVRSILMEMNKKNINLSGSRGYVYMSAAMARMVELLEADTIVQPTLFTRSCGLRSKMFDLYYDNYFETITDIITGSKSQHV